MGSRASRAARVVQPAAPVDGLRRKNQAARIDESLPYSLGKLEPGGTADEFVRALLPAVVKLAELIEQISWSVDRIDALERKLDETNKLLDNMLKVLSSGGGAV